MSVDSLEKKAEDVLTPPSIAGAGSPNPSTSRDYVDDLEKNAAMPAISQQQRNSNQPKPANRRKQNKNLLMGIFTSKTLRKRSALSALLLVLFGGGGLLSVFFSPSLALVHAKEIFTESLNDQLKAVDERSAVLLRGKLKDITKGSCGAIKINCKFATISEKQADKFRAAGIEMDLDKSYGFGENRGKIMQIRFVNDDGEKVAISTAKELNDHLLGPKAANFRSKMQGVHNPLVKGFGDKVALNTMRMWKVGKNLVATGSNDNERRQNVNNNVVNGNSVDAKTIIIKPDEDGKEHYFDPETGEEYTKEQVDTAEEQSKRIGASEGTSKVLKQAVMGASIVGYMDAACTVYNSMRFTSALAKVQKKAQAIRYSMATVLTPADSIKAGDAQEGDINYLMNNKTEIKLVSKVVDESKLYEEGSAQSPPVTDDPEAGQNFFDSPGYKTAAHNDAPILSLRAARFMIAGGSVVLLDGILKTIAVVVNRGDPNPQQVSEKCGYIQNPAVRFAGLAIGVIAGVGSFGLFTAVGIGGSMALALSLPYIEAQAAEIIAGDLFKDLSGIDSGDAAYVGAAGYMGSVAMNRGLKPLTEEEGLEQLAANKQVQEKYAENERQLARATPFDLTNRYSFLGSMAFSLVPTVERSKTSGSMAMASIASLIPTSFASLFPSAKAASVNPEYFKRCNDQAYKQLKIACGPFGEERYGISAEELAMDQFANNNWMAETGNIDPASETGEPKDNGKEWNYVKYLKQCTYRTVGWGENQDENEGDGSNCLKPENEALNKHFRVYTLDRSVDDMYDGEDLMTTSSAGYRSGQSSTVGTDGWALPVNDTFTVTSGYEDTTRDDVHKGIDLAGASDGQTAGQPIFAAREGRVIAAGRKGGYGNWIVIEHIIDGRKMSTVYGHMEDDGLLVKVNDRVTTGQEIGKVGNSGNSTGPHLHFELLNGSPLDGGSHEDPTAMITTLIKEREVARNV